MILKEKAEVKAKEYQVTDVCQVWNGGCPNVKHASMQMFEWTKKEVMDKVTEWIGDNIWDYIDTGSWGDLEILKEVHFDEMFNALRKAMEE